MEQTVTQIKQDKELETVIEEVLANLKELESLTKTYEELKDTTSKKLEALKAKLGKPGFQHRGVYYLIKSRTKAGRGPRYFLNSSSVPFGSWFKKDKNEN